MTEETTQTVVDASQAVATPTAADNNAQGTELESFLSEYENGTKPQTQPVQQQTAQPDPTKEALAEIQNWRQERAQEKHTKDLAEAVKSVKGEFDVPEWAVQGWIDQKARENKSIQDIWNNRENNPAALNRLLSSMKKEFAGLQKKGTVDQDATADRAAVAVAVRGASTQTPVSQPPKFGKMTNHEFNQYLRENGINSAV